MWARIGGIDLIGTGVVLLQETKILSSKSRYMDRMIRKAIEIELHPNNMNREDGICRSWSWKPLIHSL
jgi:hypothetical protein